MKAAVEFRKRDLKSCGSLPFQEQTNVHVVLLYAVFLLAR